MIGGVFQLVLFCLRFRSPPFLKLVILEIRSTCNGCEIGGLGCQSQESSGRGSALWGRNRGSCLAKLSMDRRSLAPAWKRQVDGRVEAALFRISPVSTRDSQALKLPSQPGQKKAVVGAGVRGPLPCRSQADKMPREREKPGSG